jgi:hypothetical protein
MNELFCRVALPAGVMGFALAGLILPMIRHRLRHGQGTGFVIADVRDPVGKAVGVAMTTQSNFVGAYALAFAAFGAERMDVFAGVPAWLGPLGLGLLLFAITLILLWGVFLLAPSPWSAGLIFSGTMFVSIQARLEEAHLIRLHGAAYRAFAARVGRFLPGVGRLSKTAGEG